MILRDRWSPAYLAREARSNVFGRRSKAFALLLLAVTMGTGSAAFAVYEALALDATISALAERGRNIVVIASPDPEVAATIDRESCERIANIEGVERAGLLESLGEESLMPLGDAITIYGASATLVPELTAHDVVVGFALADSSLSRAPGSTARFRQPDGTIAAAVVGQHQPEGIDTNWGVTVALAPEVRNGDACVVVFDQTIDATLGLPGVVSQLAVSTAPVVGYPVLTETSNPIADFLARPGRFLPIAVGILGGVATALLYRIRASELAAYRLSGSSPLSLATLLAFENFLVAGCAGSAMALTGLVLGANSGTALEIVESSFVTLSIWAIVGWLGSVSLTLRKPSELAKDR